jgi:2-oxoglutarate ferredoxin oxidoreductase subunit delta
MGGVEKLKEGKMLKQLQYTGAIQVLVNADRCKGCGYCIKVCPRKILHLAKQVNQLGCTPAEANKEREQECTGCLSCAIMCPDTAITICKTDIPD